MKLLKVQLSNAQFWQRLVKSEKLPSSAMSGSERLNQFDEKMTLEQFRLASLRYYEQVAALASVAGLIHAINSKPDEYIDDDELSARGEMWLIMPMSMMTPKQIELAQTRPESVLEKRWLAYCDAQRSWTGFEDVEEEANKLRKVL